MRPASMARRARTDGRIQQHTQRSGQPDALLLVLTWYVQSSFRLLRAEINQLGLDGRALGDKVWLRIADSDVPLTVLIISVAERRADSGGAVRPLMAAGLRRKAASVP